VAWAVLKAGGRSVAAKTHPSSASKSPLTTRSSQPGASPGVGVALALSVAEGVTVSEATGDGVKLALSVAEGVAEGVGEGAGV
jgi:hypothetical protein